LGFNEFIFLPRLPCATQTLETVCMRVLARFILSASDLTHFPFPTVPEIAFLGRSNVGKSSLINSLVGKKLARTSNTPGRTRSINFFEVRRAGQPRPELVFADLPGYGYAKVSREISEDWARFVDPYLHQRPSLALCLVLVDSNIPPQESDGQLLEFLASKGRPHVIVATKCDRLSGNELRQAMRTLGQAYAGAPMVAFSAKTGVGKEELWRQIQAALPKFPAV
jgi:GTP-binding protein